MQDLQRLDGRDLAWVEDHEGPLSHPPQDQVQLLRNRPMSSAVHANETGPPCSGSGMSLYSSGRRVSGARGPRCRIRQVSARQDCQHHPSKRMPQRQANRPIGWARNTSEPLGLAGVNKVCDLGVGLLGIGDQSFLMSFSAACWASASEAKSSGVTTLRTVSP
jgi:hypothetical protein